MTRKICVLTGTRAEFGIMHRLIAAIDAEDRFELQLIATGMHLSSEFGYTYKEIESKGLHIDKKIEILLSSDTPVAISKSMGIAQMSFASAFEELQPDLLLVLGDRFEVFAAAAAAMIARIPVAHLHGGEATEGLIDEPIRHSVTKMSHLHFTATETYRKRVIQLGEQPENVYNVGSLGVENIQYIRSLSKEELEQQLGFTFKARNLLVTFHPVTLEHNTASAQFSALLNSLSKLSDTQLIFTKANSDTEGRVINDMIDRFVDTHEQAYATFSLGQERYFNCLKYVDAAVGNSSSGLIEAPSFNIGTINIGDRQRGRVQADTVINCDANEASIDSALKTLYSADHQAALKTLQNPYEQANVCQRILDIIADVPDLAALIKKRFYNIAF